jgi:citrate lyase subunit beta/citryl-CoA lyase
MESSTDIRATGEAGVTGEEVRSDAFVRVELRSGGGIVIDLESKVKVLFGDSIREAARSAAERFGVTDARIEIDDRGALPFVLDARIEAAFLAAGARAPDAPAVRTAARPPSPRARLRRSRLYLPGNEPKFMVNAGLHRPDAVILDLEDSVHPDHKDAARRLVCHALRDVDFGAAERMVRINQLPLGFRDLEAVVPEQPDLVLVPKVESASQVAAVHDRIASLSGATDRPVWIMPILESALGIESAFEIARAAGTVVALTMGLEDYTADLGVVKTPGGDESRYARTRLVNAARAAGLQAIDSVFGDVGDMEGLADWARRSRGLGFEGMGCVHPRQIGPIHAAFAPTGAEIEKALLIVVAFEEAEREGRSVVSVGSRMVDPPVVLRARRLVDLARRAGLLGQDGAAPHPGQTSET